MLTILFWGALYIYKKFSMLVILFWDALYILRSRQCLPFYFGEHFIFMRSCLHLPFYHVWLRWRKSYNSLYNPIIMIAVYISDKKMLYDKYFFLFLKIINSEWFVSYQAPLNWVGGGRSNVWFYSLIIPPPLLTWVYLKPAP